MVSQSKLTSNEGIAEELAKDQRQISIAEFFEKNKHVLGFDSDARSIVTAVKEAVDNSLDAAQEAEILPEISVEIEKEEAHYVLTVEDNGPGITPEQAPNIFGKLLYGSRFDARVQMRGQQGIGISAAVMYGQLTTGHAAEITSITPSQDEARYFEIRIDTETNEPVVESEKTIEWDKDHGTRIKIRLEANMRSHSRLLEYAKRTAVVNPHATLNLKTPKTEIEFERSTTDIPEQPTEIKPHPYGVELGNLQEMLKATDSYSVSGFLQSEFTRVGSTTAENIIDTFRDIHFGREICWKPDQIEQEDLEQQIRDVVYRKGKEVTEEYAKLIADEIFQTGGVSYSDIVEIVNTAAEDAIEEFGRSFGSTVREKSVNAAWEFIRENSEATIHDIIEEATTSKKKAETKSELSNKLFIKIENKRREKDRYTKAELHEMINSVADTVENSINVSIGDTSRENILEELWDNMRTVQEDVPPVKEIASDRDLASELHRGMQNTEGIISPPSDCLSPIGEELIKTGLSKVYENGDFYTASQRSASSHSGEPFIAEAGIAYGVDVDKAEVLRFANRVPLVYQRGACAITDVVKDIDWRNYNIDQTGGTGIPGDSIVILGHVASTNVPFTSESKDAVANVEIIEKELERAMREAARELRKHLNRRSTQRQRRRKEKVIDGLLEDMANKFANVIDEDPPDISPTLAEVMNNCLVSWKREGENVEIEVRNNLSKTASITITSRLTREPTNIPETVSVRKDDGEWVVTWEVDVNKGEEEKVLFNWTSDGRATAEVEITGLDETELTLYKTGD